MGATAGEGVTFRVRILAGLGGGRLLGLESGAGREGPVLSPGDWLLGAAGAAEARAAPGLAEGRGGIAWVRPRGRGNLCRGSRRSDGRSRVRRRVCQQSPGLWLPVGQAPPPPPQAIGCGAERPHEGQLGARAPGASGAGRSAVPAAAGAVREGRSGRRRRMFPAAAAGVARTGDAACGALSCPAERGSGRAASCRLSAAPGAPTASPGLCLPGRLRVDGQGAPGRRRARAGRRRAPARTRRSEGKGRT